MDGCFLEYIVVWFETGPDFLLDFTQRIWQYDSILNTLH